jgi:hypothetical protein
MTNKPESKSKRQPKLCSFGFFLVVVSACLFSVMLTFSLYYSLFVGFIFSAFLLFCFYAYVEAWWEHG